MSLFQPWASLIAFGVKSIETRSWAPPDALLGERVAIHATVRCVAGPVGEFDVERDNPRGSPPAYLLRGPIGWPYRLPLGAVVATAVLVDAVTIVSHDDPRLTRGDRIAEFVHEGDLPHQQGGLWLTGPRVGSPTRVESERPYGDFTPGRWAWILDDVQPFPEPIPARGRQRLWEWSP